MAWRNINGCVGVRSMEIVLFCWLVFSSWAVDFVASRTDSPDASALNVMYSSMNSPSQLDGWKSSGGDPCGDSWKGIKCSGSKITEIDISGLGLSGSLGYKLSDLTSLTNFDVSKNNFRDSLPYQLPPNLERIDLSQNAFSGMVPYSISQMTNLKEINMNRNKLNGQLIDMFAKLSKLENMDFSFNSLSGDLPWSFRNLSKLTTLHLQNNQFTGSLNVLADLPLDDLNVGNNKFSGWVPNELKSIKKLETGGNSWTSGPAPPPPPGARSSLRVRQSSGGRSGMSGWAIGGIVFGILAVLGIIIALFVMKRKRPPPSHYLEEDRLGYIEEDRLSRRRPFTPLSSKEPPDELNAEAHIDVKESKPLKSPSSFKIKSLLSSSSIRLKPPPSDRLRSFNDNGLKSQTSVKRSNSVHVSPYSLAELQSATGNFATGRLLGEGTIGRVYRAKYSDGKVLAVKKIGSSHIREDRGMVFTEIVSLISKLHNPNIAELVGYCSEQGQNMLVYEYFRNGSLYGFLHLSDDFSRPLTWNTRVKIALGTARAVEYLHEVCSPSCVHKNIKSSNILLDIELNPCLSDCGLAIFHEQTSENLGVGYNAPECTNPSAYTLKSDVYSFGVVMLELMTGRMPFDSKRPKYEQSLVRWATPQLHDIDALDKMVDPALCGLYPPKSLSRFADVIALCVQSEPEFRPPMSEVVQALVRLVQRSNMNQRDDLSASRRTDDFDY